MLRRSILALVGPILLTAQSPIPGFPPGVFQNRAAIDGGSVAYVGPGDLDTFSAWWGLRGYATAYAGNAANICTPLDAVCLDVTIVSGNLNTTTLGTLACNNSTTICTAKTLYDQTGNGNDVTQATSGLRPVYIAPGAANGCTTTAFPCLSLTRASAQRLRGTITTVTQPYTISGVAKRTGSTTSFNPVIAGNGFGLFFTNAVNNAIIYAGTISGTVGATDNAFHAMNGTFNNASSALMVDGADTTGLTTGLGSFANAISIGDDGVGTNSLDGRFVEGGILSGGSNAIRLRQNNNSRAYWGF